MTIIDPPSGWRYGFPKPIPNDVKDVNKWLVENGYPQTIIDELGEYFFCRYWEKMMIMNNLLIHRKNIYKIFLASRKSIMK